MLERINSKYNYNYASFRGGISKIDVERMRQSSKSSAKSKKAKNAQSNVADSDQCYIAAVVLEKIKPQFDFLDNNLKGACSKVDAMEGKVRGQVESVLVMF